MGSKKAKKPKPESEPLHEEPASNATEKTPARGQKRKKLEESEVPAKIRKSSKRAKVEEERPQIKTEDCAKQNGVAEGEEKPLVITWPDADLTQLINKIRHSLPDEDNLSYKSRVEKLNWEQIAFNNYTAQECKDTWLLVQKRIRTFRLLGELLHDAAKWITAPKETRKPKRHPDMPKRPLSSYLLFYTGKKQEIMKQHPGLETSELTKVVGQIFKNLSPEEKENYEKQAAAKREKYARDMKLFFDRHPELQPPRSFLNHSTEKTAIKTEKAVKVEKTPSRPDRAPKGERPRGRPPKSASTSSSSIPSPTVPKEVKERPPKKSLTPFNLYFASRLPNIPEGVERQTFKDTCKVEYESMPDTDKLHWFNMAENDQQRYEQEAARYREKHPDFKGVKHVRPILTKKEMVARERAKGKPVKPPNSAYALYSRLLLQSQDIKVITPKERMNFIANKWRECPEDEKSRYRDRIKKMNDKYKVEYATYLQSLPEEERKKLEPVEKEAVRAKPKGRPKKERSSARKEKTKSKPKFTEPEQPHRSPSKYFASVYKGEGDPAKAWKSLNPEDKRRYEAELTEKKRQYIVEFEKFLKSLSKEELEQFSKSRQEQLNSDDEDDDDEESSECSSESTEDGGGDEDEESDGDDSGSD